MTIATDWAAYYMAQKALTVTSTSTVITGTAGLAGEDIPSDVNHITIQPSGGKVYWNLGTASTSTALIPSDGIVINAPSAPALRGVELYSPTGATALVTFGGPGGKVVLGGGNAESYNVGEPFTALIDDSAATAALTDPAPVAAKAEVIGTAAHGVIDTRGQSVARIMFGGTDAADEAFNYQVIAWSQVIGQSAEGWIPRVIAKGLVTLGADVYAVAGVGGATNFFADTITDTILDGATVYTVTDQRAVLEVSVRDAERIEVQTDLTTAAKADAFIQLGGGDSAIPISVEANIGNVGLLDTTETEIDPAIKSEQQILTSAPVEKTPIVVVKTATSGSQAALVASETFARAVYLQAKKVGGDNTGNIFLGTSAVSVGDAELFELTPGATYELEMPAGTKVDINDIYIDVDTTGDGVIGWYIPI